VPGVLQGTLGEERQLNTQLAKFADDGRKSFRQWRLWMHLGLNDIAKQYRRSFLGPVWITLNTGIFIVAFSLIGAQLFKQDVNAYLAYFATGYIFFTFFSAVVTEGCAAFTGAESYLKQGSVPKLTFVMRVIVRDLVMLGHNAIIIVGALLWLGSIGQVRLGSLLFGLAMCIVAAFFIIGILGTVAARFRDIPMMVTSAMQVLFFLTPVMWRPEQLTERGKWLVVLNPFAIFLDLVRKPLLGQATSLQTVVSAAIVIAILAAIFVPLFLVARRKIVYWL
jgi:ABC-type polysaccharide/polyol phosphate export permease